MVFNNTSPHPTPLPDWLVSLSCLYPFAPRTCIFPTVTRVWNSWIPLPLNIRTTRSFETLGIIYPVLQRIQNSTNSRYRSFQKFLSSRLPLCNLWTGIYESAVSLVVVYGSGSRFLTRGLRVVEKSC